MYLNPYRPYPEKRRFDITARPDVAPPSAGDRTNRRKPRVDEHREEIEAIAHLTSLTEPEARARYHLKKAHAALKEVADTPVAPEVEPPEPMRAYADIFAHLEAIDGFLARRVLERERPGGWGR
jgi:hypothetical protein